MFCSSLTDTFGFHKIPKNIHKQSHRIQTETQQGKQLNNSRAKRVETSSNILVLVNIELRKDNSSDKIQWSDKIRTGILSYRTRKRTEKDTKALHTG